MIKKFAILLILISLPYSVLAQTTDSGGTTGETADSTGTGGQTSDSGQVEQPAVGQPQLQVPVTDSGTEQTSSGDARLLVTAKNKKTGRLLGGVKITVENNSNRQEDTLDDPPQIEGQNIVQKIIPGKYLISATRKGYKALQEEINVSSSALKLTLELEPDSNTPDPDLEFARRVQLMELASLYSPSYQQFPYPNQYPYQTPPIFDGNGYGYNPGQDYWNDAPYGYPPYSQYGYVLSANQQAVIPLEVNIIATNLFNSYQTFDVQIVDPTINNVVSLISYSGSQNNYNSYLPNFSLDTTLKRYGCVKPNQQYILRINNPGTGGYGTNSYQDYPFTSTALGGFTKIDLREETIGLSVIGPHPSIIRPNVQNLPLQGYQMPIQCPTSYSQQNQSATWPSPAWPNQTQSQATYGTTTWGDSTINPATFGNYSVVRSAERNAYFLVNNASGYYQDVRPISFVENNSGTGGLAFVPAQSGNLLSYNNGSQWYVTTYTRNVEQIASSCKANVDRLISLPEFGKLSTNQQADFKADAGLIPQVNPSMPKVKLELCLTLKNKLLPALRAINPNITDENMQTPLVNVDIQKFSRVNFSPQEYSQVIAGKPLHDF